LGEADVIAFSDSAGLVELLDEKRAFGLILIKRLSGALNWQVLCLPVWNESFILFFTTHKMT
jgi:hypothetical protein